MDTLKKTREVLLETYPDTDFYWVTPGPVDFRHLNRNQIVNTDRQDRELEKNHGHYTMTEYMWKNIIANYNKRLKVLNDEIPGNMTINWFTRSCWQNRDNRGKKSDDSIQQVLQGDLSPIKATGLIEEGENLTVKGGQAMWMIIRKKINWYRKAQAKAKEDKEKGEDPSGITDDDDKNEEDLNGKGEDANMDSDLHESQIKKLGGSSSIKTTIIGDSWIQILSEIERWQPNPRNRKHVKVYPDLTLDSVIEKVDVILSEEADTENLVLSVFQNHISIGLSASNVENEFIPCAYSTVEDLLEKASNIGKYLKKTYPKVKVFWVSPGPVGYYNEKEKEEEMRKEEKEKRKAEEKKKAEERKKLEEKKKAEEKKEKERKEKEKEKKKQEKEKKKQEKEKKKLEKEKKKLEKE